jgi:hypothetical protein
MMCNPGSLLDQPHGEPSGATMEREPNHPLNTREFTAKWHDIVEEHVVPSLAAALPRLMTGTTSESVRTEQWEGVARHLAHALQVAASSSGGVQAAVEYLQQMAGTPPGESR